MFTCCSASAIEGVACIGNNNAIQEASGHVSLRQECPKPTSNTQPQQHQHQQHDDRGDLTSTTTAVEEENAVLVERPLFKSVGWKSLALVTTTSSYEKKNNILPSNEDEDITIDIDEELRNMEKDFQAHMVQQSSKFVSSDLTTEEVDSRETMQVTMNPATSTPMVLGENGNGKEVSRVDDLNDNRDQGRNPPLYKSPSSNVQAKIQWLTQAFSPTGTTQFPGNSFEQDNAAPIAAIAALQPVQQQPQGSDHSTKATPIPSSNVEYNAAAAATVSKSPESLLAPRDADPSSLISVRTSKTLPFTAGYRDVCRDDEKAYEFWHQLGLLRWHPSRSEEPMDADGMYVHANSFCGGLEDDYDSCSVTSPMSTNTNSSSASLLQLLAETVASVEQDTTAAVAEPDSAHPNNYCGGSLWSIMSGDEDEEEAITINDDESIENDGQVPLSIDFQTPRQFSSKHELQLRDPDSTPLTSNRTFMLRRDDADDGDDEDGDRDDNVDYNDDNNDSHGCGGPMLFFPSSRDDEPLDRSIGGWAANLEPMGIYRNKASLRAAADLDAICSSYRTVLRTSRKAPIVSMFGSPKCKNKNFSSQSSLSPLILTTATKA